MMRNVLSDRQIVELFHLHFVRLLCAGADRHRFGIKGGCNLRFFFESVRYSEDIDFDVTGIPEHTLKEKVNRVLGGPALAMPLRSRGISIGAVTAPKQTETTQRWKVGLSIGATLPLHTKLEFSRRQTTEGAVVEPVSAGVLAEYQMMPVLAPHYPLPSALRQEGGAMNAPEALSRLRKLGVPAATTADAAAVLGISLQAASHTMRRLARTGLVRPVRRGIWALGDRPDPLVLADYVTAPYPSYVSLQTALYRHGMINQIPEMTFLVSLARSARVSTLLGTYSIHHVQPALFGGFEMLPDSGIKIATPEKALVDFLYLSPTRGRLFAALPELELPRGFRRAEARRWVARIPSTRRKTIVARKLNDVLARVGTSS